jgi:hypothetical protein
MSTEVVDKDDHFVIFVVVTVVFVIIVVNFGKVVPVKVTLGAFLGSLNLSDRRVCWTAHIRVPAEDRLPPGHLAHNNYFCRLTVRHRHAVHLPACCKSETRQQC